ncbi:MAG: hypothetical protein LGR52_04860 [Candidatus Thiosymbion ectosymbiont of Robbea hypermnestra]|nr:hypothetical protein [Candidatus Thiosymbion ectosymbiont of Robbea hypermnestra]
MLRFVLLLPVLLAWPAFGSECFCLVTAADTTWFDCRELPCSCCPQPRIFCLDAATGEQKDLTKRADLERVADGEPRCSPCRLSDMPGLKHIPRGEHGEDDTQKTPPATTPRPGDEEEKQP